MENKLGRRLLAGAAGLILGGLSQVANSAQVDLLVLYDDYSASRLGGEPSVVMKSWQDQMNTMYRNSDVDIQLRVVGVERHNVSAGSMNGVLTDIVRSSSVAQIRDRYGADFVTQIHQAGNCGVGYLAVDVGYAFNVVGPSCGPRAMIHELGHNMGLNHSRRQGDTSGALYRYALGHGAQGVFATLMTYEWDFRAPLVSVFSNPRINCNGQPCGVPEGQSQEADAAKALNNVKARIAAFKPTRVSGGGNSGGGGAGGGGTGGGSGGGSGNGSGNGSDNGSGGNTDNGSPVSAGQYVLKIGGGERCLGGNRSGWFINDAVEWNCNQAQNQQWTVSPQADGFVKLQNASTQQCLNVMFGNTEAGANVIQWTCSDRDSQEWKLVPKGNNRYQVVARHSGLCLNANAGTNGGSVVQTQCGDDASQRFTFQSM